MRKSVREQYFDYFNLNKFFFGRTYLNDKFIYDILGNKKYNSFYPYGINWMGWFKILYTGYYGWKIIYSKLYPIYEFNKNNQNNYDLKIITYLNEKEIIENFSNIKIDKFLLNIKEQKIPYIYIDNDIIKIDYENYTK